MDVVPEILLCMDPVIVGTDDDGRAVLWPFAAGGGVLGGGHHSQLAAVVGDEGPAAGLQREGNMFIQTHGSDEQYSNLFDASNERLVILLEKVRLANFGT